MTYAPRLDFEQLHDGLTAAVRAVGLAFQAYRRGDLVVATDSLSPLAGANENGPEENDAPGVVPVDLRQRYFGDYAPVIVAACIDRIRHTQEEIGYLLELAGKAPDVREVVLNDAEDGVDYISRTMSWLIAVAETKDVQDYYPQALKDEDKEHRRGLADSFETQAQMISDIRGGRSNVTTLHTTADDLNNILDKIAECRYETCEIEYNRVDAILHTAADFLTVLIDEKKGGRTHPDAPAIELFIINALTKSPAHLMQLSSRLKDIAAMMDSRRYAEERKHPYLPHEFPDFSL